MAVAGNFLVFLNCFSRKPTGLFSYFLVWTVMSHACCASLCAAFAGLMFKCLCFI